MAGTQSGMLSGRSSSLRDWVMFALIAVLPAGAMAGLASFALRNEEAALRRETRLQVERTAASGRDELIAALQRLRRGADPATEPLADPLVISRTSLTGEAEARTDTEGRCATLAAQLAQNDRATATETRAAIRRECQAARTAGGRLLWPLAAMTDQVAASELRAWIASHGHALDAAERQALRDEVATAAWLSPADRDELVGQLKQDGHALRRLWAARRPAMLAGVEHIHWSDGRSIGQLEPADGSYRGFVVHAGSLLRAQEAGWPQLEPGMRARLATRPDAHPDEDVSHAVELPLRGVYLVVAHTQLDDVVWRSNAALIALSSLSALVALSLGGWLFVRLRRARQLSRLRTDFVAAVSHELRTPIASLQMLSELLAEGRAEADEIDELHQALHREAKRLGTTVDRLLSFSRMEAGKRSARLARGHVAGVVEEAIATFEERHPESAPVARDLDAAIEAEIDADALAMAIGNLLQNAHKYAPDGRPYAVAVGATGANVCIAVRDHGPGIAKRDQRRIFEPFERADDRLSRATDGSGIGLSLVKHVARVHGGRVALDSKPGEGATFKLLLPMSPKS